MSRLFGTALALACAALSSGGCGAPAAPPPPPKKQVAPLDTSSLAALTQGPGVKVALLVSPKALFSGPLASAMTKLLPNAGMDRLTTKLGFDLRLSREAMIVELAATTFYAARLPDGVAPSSALAAYEETVIPPKTRASPRPDLMRVTGKRPGGLDGSAAGLWSSLGDVIVAESGRLGPVLASMLLAAGKLPKERSLAYEKTFAPLLVWAKGAEIAIVGRCPLGGKMLQGGNVLTQECDGAALTIRPGAPGKLAVAVRVNGAWGKDAELVSEAMRGTFHDVSESDLGRVLGMRDVTPEITATKDAVTGQITLDADVVATGLFRVLEPDLPK